MITPGISKVTSETTRVFEGPLDVNVMFQNQGSLAMVLGLDPELVDAVELRPLHSFVAPEGTQSVWGKVPAAKAGTTFALFHSPVASPPDVWL